LGYLRKLFHYYHNKKLLYKFSKFIFLNIFLNLLIYGIIVGVIVTFFFNTPKISLVNTTVNIEENNYNFGFVYENKGQTPAINVEYIIRYIVLNNKNEVIYPIEPGKAKVIINKLDKYEVGDMLTLSFSINAQDIGIGENIFENAELIILAKTRYKDSSNFRYFINNKLLNNQYSTYRLAFYDVSEKKSFLSSLKFEKRNEFKDMINIWLED